MFTVEFTFANIIAYGLCGILKFRYGITGVAFMFLLMGFVLITSAAGYLLGSFNPAITVSKRLYGRDIRECGSGNAGMTNMFRVFGKKAGFLTLAGDMLKTVIATLIGYLMFGNVPFLFQNGFVMFGRFGAYLAGMFCVIGHLFPCFYRFKGGKGVLVAAVVLLMTDWPVLVMSLLIFAIVFFGTKYVSLASVMSALMMPLLLNIWFRIFNYAAGTQIEGGMSIPIMMVVAVMIVLRHIPNIKRIREGSEPKVTMPWEKNKNREWENSSKRALKKASAGTKKGKSGESLSGKDK